MMTWKGKVLGDQVAAELDFCDNNDELRDYLRDYVLLVILICLEGRSKEKEKWNNLIRTKVMSEILIAALKSILFPTVEKDVSEDQA